MWLPTEIFKKLPEPPMPNHENAMTGKWGEDIATCFLRNHGWDIIGRRVRPCRRDRRCEIDVIARSRDRHTVVFVEVKTHAMRSPHAAPLWGVDRRKKNVLLRACANWILREKWHGNFRFDVIQVFGRRTSPRPPEIDHFENVPLFPAKWRFW
jgi:Holliday junction resolvase-like predicted endonuclease